MDRRTLSGAAVLIAVFAAFGAWRWAGSGTVAATITETTTHELAGPATWSNITLRVRSVIGDVTVVGDPEADRVSAELVRIAGGRNRAQAGTLLEQATPQLRWSEDRTRIIVETDRPFGPAADRLETIWRLTVPASLAVSVRTDVGAVAIQRLAGETDVRTDVGDITVVGGSGTVTAVADVGDVEVESSGAVTARTDSGRVRINGEDQ